MVSAKNCSVCNFLVPSLDGKDIELSLNGSNGMKAPWFLCADEFWLVGLAGSKRTGLLRSGLGIDG